VARQRANASRARELHPAVSKAKASLMADDKDRVKALRALGRILPDLPPESIEKIQQAFRRSLPKDLSPEVVRMLTGDRETLAALASLKITQSPLANLDPLVLQKVLDVVEGPMRRLFAAPQSESKQRANKPGPGHPNIKIPYLDEALTDLGKARPDPRLRVTTKDDINPVINFLRKRGVKVPEEQIPTIRRRIKKWREARMP
jgi:hypothetical protein